jgi:hypothetical protein
VTGKKMKTHFSVWKVKQVFAVGCDWLDQFFSTMYAEEEKRRVLFHFYSEPEVFMVAGLAKPKTSTEFENWFQNRQKKTHGKAFLRPICLPRVTTIFLYMCKLWYRDQQLSYL